MNKRNAEIDLLKFFFSMVIVLHHANIPGFPVMGGYLAVEFFFSVTGVYLWKKFEINYSERNEIAFSGTNKYVLNRIMKIYPYYLLSCLVSIVHESLLLVKRVTNDLQISKSNSWNSFVYLHFNC